MGKRYVDADVLEDLARSAGSARQDVQGLFSKCQGRVTAVLRGGWQGTWDDVRNTLGSEMTSLEDHGRELVNRAARVREVAKERALQELRELWGAIAGLRKEIESTAGWLKGFWEKWERSFRNSVLPDPLPRLQPGPGAAIGALVGIALTWAWKEALQLLHGTSEPEAPAVSEKQLPKPELPTITTEIKAESREQWVQRKTEEFRGHHPEDEPVTDPDTGGCVALVMRYASEALNAPLGTYWHGGPNGEWANRQAFGPEWERIEAGALRGYQVGDIAFFDWSGKGHVGVVVWVSDDGKTVKIMDQAYNGRNVDIRTYSVSEANHSDLYCQEEKVHHYLKGVMRLK